MGRQTKHEVHPRAWLQAKPNHSAALWDSNQVLNITRLDTAAATLSVIVGTGGSPRKNLLFTGHEVSNGLGVGTKVVDRWWTQKLQLITKRLICRTTNAQVMITVNGTDKLKVAVGTS